MGSENTDMLVQRIKKFTNKMEPNLAILSAKLIIFQNITLAITF